MGFLLLLGVGLLIVTTGLSFRPVVNNLLLNKSAISIDIRHKIIGGVDTSPGEAPWHISLQYQSNQFFGRKYHICSGSILDATHIITTAHCVFGLILDFNIVEVVAGAQNVKNVTESQQQRIRVNRFFPHESFRWDTAKNDIAVIILSRPLKFDKYVQPLRLPSLDETPERECTVTGWGYSNPGSGEVTGAIPDALQKLTVNILPRAECQRIYAGIHNVSETMICAGNENEYEGLGVCTNDSGGALVCFNNRSNENDRKEPYLAGIVSWGNYPCGEPGFPNVFTDIASFLPFLEEIP